MTVDEILEKRGDKILRRKRIEDPLGDILGSWIEELTVRLASNGEIVTARIAHIDAFEREDIKNAKSERRRRTA